MPEPRGIETTVTITMVPVRVMAMGQEIRSILMHQTLAMTPTLTTDMEIPMGATQEAMEFTLEVVVTPLTQQEMVFRLNSNQAKNPSLNQPGFLLRSMTALGN